VSRYVDFPADGPSVGRCVILPGRAYTPDGPLLFFAAQTARVRGWDVRQVWWDPPTFADDAAEVAWVGDELDAAVTGDDGSDRDDGGPVVVVAKSLGTLAAARAAARGYPGAWLTPLLSEPDAAAVLLSYPAEQLVLIGTEDPFLRREVLDALPGQRLLVTGDHVLRVPGDPGAMVAAHERFVGAFDAWLTALRTGSASRLR
jgi:hypothetical protein